MDNRPGQRRWLPELAGLLTLLVPFAALAFEPSEPAINNLYLEGNLPGATLLTLEAADAKEGGEIELTLLDGKVGQGVAIPEGESKLRLRAENADGKVLYEGEAELSGDGDLVPQTTVGFKSSLDGAPAEVRIASHRVALEFAGVEREGVTYTRLIVNVFDADGTRVDASAKDLAWHIDDPWFGDSALPCPEGNGASLCVEFPPRKEAGFQISADACWRGRICTIEFVPPTPQVWRTLAVSRGGHGCALKLTGEAFCWGRGELGQLGYAAPSTCPTMTSNPSVRACSLRPRAVTCASGSCLFTDITAGATHTCAIDRNQDAWCWGGNAFGELGVGTSTTSEVIPQKVVGGVKFVAIRAAQNRTCGLTTRHDVYCWGDNSTSFVPDSADWELHQPTRVKLNDRLVDLDTYLSHVCARSAAGSLYCWGANGAGQLGPSTYKTAPTCRACPVAPLLMQRHVAAVFLQRVSLMSTGDNGTCANLASGVTPCWGLTLPSWPAVQPLQRLSRGSLHYCAIGIAWMQCAGLGALGDGNNYAATYTPVTNNYTSGVGPVRVPAPAYFYEQVDTGNQVTCAIAADANVHCWGENVLGATGLGLDSGTTLSPTALKFGKSP